MRRTAVSLVLALVVVGVATASRGEPKRQITPADQARAKAMLLRQVDVGADFEAAKLSQNNDLYCKALDESDLVLTGDAKTLNFAKVDVTNRTYLSVASFGQVYRTAAQSAASWHRSTSPAGEKCAELLLRNQLKGSGGTLVSFRKIAFPRLAPETAAYRVTASVVNPAVFDLVAFKNGRAQATILFVGSPSAYPRPEEVRLGGIVARHMATAMGRR